MKRTDPRMIDVDIPVTQDLFYLDLTSLIGELKAIKTKYPGARLCVEAVPYQSDSYYDDSWTAGLKISCSYSRMETPMEVEKRIQTDKDREAEYKAATLAKERALYEELKKKFEPS